MCNGSYLARKNLNYQELSSMIEKVGGLMLNILSLNNFYYIRNFTDMRCKYDCVLSIVREQLHREPFYYDVKESSFGLHVYVR